MRDISEYVTPTSQPACWTAENLVKFSSPALDYSPTNPDYRHLSVKDHARNAVAKWKAERDCVLTCLSCPLLEQCQQIDMENMAKGEIASGVMGARPEEVRRNPSKVKPLGLRAYVESVVAIVRGEAKAPRQIQDTTHTANADIAPGDRGPRGQINDELVRRMVISGRTGDQIAADLGCDPRSVSRAKKRLGLTRNCRTNTEASTAATITATTTGATPPVRTPASSPAQPQPRPSTTNRDSDTFTAMALAEVHTAATTPSSVAPATAQAVTDATPDITIARPGGTRSGAPFASQRKVTAAMTTVYNHLATVASASTETLLALAAEHIDAADAEKWWTERNTITVDGQRHIKPTQAHTTVEDRIAAGRRAKAFNALSAAHRNAGYLIRDHDLWSFDPAAKAAWLRRRDQVGTFAESAATRTAVA